MSLTFLFRCNIPGSQKKLLVLNPMDFPLHFLNYDFLPKGFWWFPTACGVQLLHLASKHLWCFNVLGANHNCTLPRAKLDTITLSSRHGSSLPSLNLPCAYILSSAENFLLLTPPLAGIHSSLPMCPVQVFPTHPHSVQLP